MPLIDPDEQFTPAPCSVVDGIYCLAPSNARDDIRTRAHCFACGEAVCINCSLRISYYNYGTKRICHHCIRERFGEYDPRVYAHLWVLAGYTAAEGQSAAREASAAASDIAARRSR